MTTAIMAPSIAPIMAPIIVTALLGPEDFARLDALRRAHFPPERNQLRAHLTLFHHLPPSAADEVATRLAMLTRGPAPRALLIGPMALGGGTALRVASEDLELIRAELASAFAGLLTPQDRAGWRPHVTIQNKVKPAVARVLQQAMAGERWPRPLAIAGLAVWWYRGGPWELIRAYPFR